MKTFITTCVLVALVQFASIGLVLAQLTSLPSGGNKKAAVSEQIGITEITINYSRPHVNNREGHIWGELIPVGYTDLGFGTSKAAPWRAGANENTVVEFSTDVKIEGQPLAAGKYGFFIAYDPTECTLIFSKNSSSWGSYYYNPAEDVLRVKVKPVQADKNVEWLKYEFTNQTPSAATVTLQWEKLIIPFNIEVDVINTLLASYRNELRSNKGFTWESWNEAALYCAQNNTNLDEALLWANNATGADFGGSKSFQAWSTKAMVLDGLGRSDEAVEVMKKALPLGDMNELYYYARTLAAHKKSKEAFEIFKMNYDKYPDVFLTNAGMARGYSTIGDYKKALVFAKKAQAQAPDQPNKSRLDAIVKTLQEGKDIN